MQNLSDQQISDYELEEAKNIYTHNIQQTKEALYYRKIFNKYYPQNDNVIDHYWLPKFQDEIIRDPSATILKCY